MAKPKKGTYRIREYPSGTKRPVCVSCGRTLGALSGKCSNPKCPMSKR